MNGIHITGFVEGKIRILNCFCPSNSGMQPVRMRYDSINSADTSTPVSDADTLQLDFRLIIQVPSKDR